MVPLVPVWNPPQVSDVVVSIGTRMRTTSVAITDIVDAGEDVCVGVSRALEHRPSLDLYPLFRGENLLTTRTLQLSEGTFREILPKPLLSIQYRST